MTKKYLMFSLDDEKAKKLGETISNPTCNKIVNLLAEKEASEAEIAKQLKIPVNTVEYNLKKLLHAGLIEKSKKFFWSVKGKKIDMYRVANKLIVISPKKSNVYSKLKSIIPAVLISGILASFIYWYNKTSFVAKTAVFETYKGVKDSVVSDGSAAAASQVADVADATAATSPELTKAATEMLYAAYSSAWIWFLVGAGIAIFAFLIWNWRKL